MVAAWGAAVTVTHDYHVVLEAEEVAGEAPDSDSFWDGPGFAAGGGFRLQSLLRVGLIVVADVDDEVAVCRFYSVELVVIVCCVAGAGGDGREPTPFETVVFGFNDADFA